jgi:hypothetical protein
MVFCRRMFIPILMLMGLRCVALNLAARFNARCEINNVLSRVATSEFQTSLRDYTAVNTRLFPALKRRAKFHRRYASNVSLRCVASIEFSRAFQRPVRNQQRVESHSDV